MYVSRLLSRSSQRLCKSLLPQRNYQFLRNIPLAVNLCKTAIRKKNLPYQGADRFPHRSMTTFITIKNDGEMFYIEMDNEKVILTYNIHDGIMEIKHTRVPKALGGHGLGKLVAKVFVDQVTSYKSLMKLLPCKSVATKQLFSFKLPYVTGVYVC